MSDTAIARCYDLLEVTPKTPFKLVQRRFLFLCKNLSRTSSEYQQFARAYVAISADFECRRNGSEQETQLPPPTSSQELSNLYDQVNREFKRSETSDFGMYATLGSVSGAVVGLLVAGVPGFVVGGAAGHGAGKLRDKHGKSVSEYYDSLTPAERENFWADGQKYLVACVKQIT
ncbi:hypothetical protein BJ741DRAFT_664478 [Chytriomyces cf. hyalinus JEL632]|nr:hypothetical protein BJ741DRAFT_664478 [Chytriomyces cf. hyalinus JEL632]